MQRSFLPFVLLSACTGPAIESGPDEASTKTGKGTNLPTSVSEALAAPAPPKKDAPTPFSGQPVASTQAVDSRPRVHSKNRLLWIYASPKVSEDWIGNIALGTSVPLKSATKVASSKSCPGFYEVEPRGFVCVDGTRATLDPTDKIFDALKRRAPNFTQALPYRYGESKGFEKLKLLPGFDAPPWPNGVQDVNNLRVRPRSTIAWVEEFVHEGKEWLYASDATFAPKEAITTFEPVTFQGVHLGEDVRLPIGFFRRRDRPQYELRGKKFEKLDQVFAKHSWVALTGAMKTVDSKAYYETKNGSWVRESDAVVVKPRKKFTPFGGRIRMRDAISHEEATRAERRWIEVSALEGFLIAYEDDIPVFATLISGGRKGAQERAKKPPYVSPSMTPLGEFSIQEKWRTKTLETPHADGNTFIEAEVPSSQRFFDKYFLHAAYWHNNWGDGQSGGCINLSPEDSKWLFSWTEPKLPEGWHTVRTWGPVTATRVIVHK